MSNIIHGSYQLIEKIGSGGGGVIYLAEHINLKKKVVLKVDKHRATAKQEILRREADILKNLHHTYIPQVYDYFVEGDIAFTVIDYVEGESLDKALKRDESFSQPQVIKWAGQLLEALAYLHKVEHGDPPKGYVHSDIKPANLMRKPNGDICLIDFNIAMTFDEDQMVGFSAGYASPEHYGIDYSSDEDDGGEKIRKAGSSSKTGSRRTISLFQLGRTQNETTQLNEKKTEQKDAVPLQPEPESADTQVTEEAVKPPVDDRMSAIYSETSKPPSSSSGSSSEKRRVIPDVRSDIYMVGATLYHLLGGSRPAKDAKDVLPLSKETFSPLLVDIIAKAMQPNPNLRYQSASEMLEALDRLFIDDPRILKHKRNVKMGITALCGVVVLGVLISFTGSVRIRRMKMWEQSIIASAEALKEGDAVNAAKLAKKAVPRTSGIWTPHMLSAAQLALTEASGVYDLSSGFKLWKTLEIPAELQFLRISPDGKTALCIYTSGLAIIDTESGSIISNLPTDQSALSEGEYIDNDTILYAGVDGLTCYQISARKKLWIGKPSTAISVSADGKYAACVYKDSSEAFLYDAQLGTLVKTIDFKDKKQSIRAFDIYDDANDSFFELNGDGSWLSCNFDDGSVFLFDLTSEDSFSVPYPKDDYISFDGGFYENAFMFTARRKDGKTVAFAYDMKSLDIIPLNSSKQYIELRTPMYEKIEPVGFILQNETNLVRFVLPSAEQIPLVTGVQANIKQFACSTDDTIISSNEYIQFFDQNAVQVSQFPCTFRPDFLAISGNAALIGSRDSKKIRVMRFEDFSEPPDFVYDHTYHHREARITQDRKNVMLFANAGFCIYDEAGNQVNKVEIPDHRNIQDQQFIRENNKSYLKVIYKDGSICCYQANTGEILEKSKGEPPDSTLYEEFITDSYKITRPVNGTPEVYNQKNGELLTTIDEEAPLTYATQIGDYLVLQFSLTDDINKTSYAYGLLLNRDLETIAKLPYLSDVIDGQLVFDYPSGYICTCPVYDIKQILLKVQGGLNK